MLFYMLAADFDSYTLIGRTGLVKQATGLFVAGDRDLNISNTWGSQKVREVMRRVWARCVFIKP